jgi:nucleotide-binding universal stress UspA family protein
VPKILLAVDGSEHGLAVTRKLVESFRWYKEAPEVELLTVHPPVPLVGGMGSVVTGEMLDKYYREEGDAQLAGAKAILDEAGARYRAHVFVGQISDTIVEQAKHFGCDMIYMGTHGRGALPSALIGSVAIKVVHLAHVPVVLIH